MPDAAAPAAHDPAKIAVLRSLGGDALVRDLVSLFLVHSAEKLGAAESALGAGDLAAAAFATHALKSSAGQLGVTAVQAACAAAERAGTAGDADATRVAVEEAVAALQAARPWLESETA